MATTAILDSPSKSKYLSRDRRLVVVEPTEQERVIRGVIAPLAHQAFGTEFPYDGISEMQHAVATLRDRIDRNVVELAGFVLISGLVALSKFP